MVLRDSAGRMPWWAKLAAGVLAVAALFFLFAKANLLPGIPNPFGEKTKDRSGPWCSSRSRT